MQADAGEAAVAAAAVDVVAGVVAQEVVVTMGLAS